MKRNEAKRNESVERIMKKLIKTKRGADYEKD